MKYLANYWDDSGNNIDIEADSVEELQEQLPKDYSGPRRKVVDEHGFIRGRIGSEGFTATG